MPSGQLCVMARAALACDDTDAGKEVAGKGTEVGGDMLRTCLEIKALGVKARAAINAFDEADRSEA